MPSMDRRTLLSAIALGVLAATTRHPSAAADSLRPATGKVPPPVGVLTRLPGDGNQLALTVDDGTNSAVVGAFAQFCLDTGTRLTFFVNGANPSWTVNAPALRPMVDSGQIQLGNHTWSHPNLTRLGAAAVADQISRNTDFLTATYGTDGRPYFRPPYGRHSPDTDRVAADLGYPTVTMWSASIGDSRPENQTDMIAKARTAFTAQQIVLAHSNLPTITGCYADLLDIIADRGLQTVTLNDVFA
jgi:peptidoglycan-N-acetylglucosamine deacetylase